MSLLNLKKKSKLKLSHKESVPKVNTVFTANYEEHAVALSSGEKKAISTLMNELAIHSEKNIAANQVEKDITELTQATLNVRQLQNQAFIYLGEKILHAKELLKKYGDSKRAFTDWLELSFGSRKTPYNILSLYEFFQKTKAKKLREKIISMPLKAAYVIASKNVDLKNKHEFVKEFSGNTAKEWLEEIKVRFPSENVESKALSNFSYFNQIRTALSELKRNKKRFSEKDWQRAEELFSEFKKLMK